MNNLIKIEQDNVNSSLMKLIAEKKTLLIHEDTLKNTIYLLDISKSMEENFGLTTRFNTMIQSLKYLPKCKTIYFNENVYEKVPNQPSGGTNLAPALDFSYKYNFKRILLIADGEAFDKENCYRILKNTVPIDILFIGEYNSTGHLFMKDLCNRTKGQIIVINSKTKSNNQQLLIDSSLKLLNRG